MGEIRSFTPEKLIIGVLTSRPALLGAVEAELVEQFGPIDAQSDLIEFSFTDYYDEEMGRPIVRLFFSFEALVSPETLPDAKIRTNRIEERYAEHGRRRVNLDPGLLSLRRLILASTKDNGRRVPLRDGIYGEITLVYVEGDYRPVEWTYPDYASRKYRDTLCGFRSVYRTQLKQIG